MKVIKEKFTKELVLVIPNNEIEPKWLKRIKDEGLYCLEDMYGECDGHGCGFGGEDISFTIKKPDLCFAINWNRRKFTIWNYLNLYTNRGKYYDSVTIEPSDTLVKYLKRRLIKKMPWKKNSKVK
jgi:hypothetical protein